MEDVVGRDARFDGKEERDEAPTRRLLFVRSDTLKHFG
jgi:hypothetical protein